MSINWDEAWGNWQQPSTYTEPQPQPQQPGGVNWDEAWQSWPQTQPAQPQYQDVPPAPAYQPAPNDIWNALTGVVGNAAQGARDPNPVTNWVTNTWDALTQPWQAPAKENQSPLEAIGDTVGRGLNSALGGFGAALEPFGGGVDLAADSNIPVVSELGGIARTAWEQAVEPAANFYTGSIGEGLHGVQQAAGDVWGNLTQGQHNDPMADFNTSLAKQPAVQFGYMLTHPEAVDQMNAYRDQLIEQERQSLTAQGYRGAALDNQLERTIEKTMNPVTMAEQLSMQDFGQLPLPEQFALSFFDKLNPGLRVYEKAIHPFQAGAGLVAGGVGKGIGAAATGLADATGTRPFFDKVGEAIEGPQLGYKMAQDEGEMLNRLFSDAERSFPDVNQAREVVLLDPESPYYYGANGISEKYADEAKSYLGLQDAQDAEKAGTAKPATTGEETNNLPGNVVEMARREQDTSPGAEKTLFAEENPPPPTEFKPAGAEPVKSDSPIFANQKPDTPEEAFKRQVDGALEDYVNMRTDEKIADNPLKHLNVGAERDLYRAEAQKEAEPFRDQLKTQEDVNAFRAEHLPADNTPAARPEPTASLDSEFGKTYERPKADILDYHRAIGIPDRAASHGDFVDAVSKSIGFKRGAFKFEEGTKVGKPKLRETQPLEQLGAVGSVLRTLNKTMPYLSRSFLNKSGRAVRDSASNVLKYVAEGFGHAKTDRFDRISGEFGTRSMGRASMVADAGGKDAPRNFLTSLYFHVTNPFDELSSDVLRAVTKGRYKDWNDFTEKAEASMKTFAYKQEFLRQWDRAIDERVKTGSLDRVVGDALKDGRLTKEFLSDYMKGKLPKGADLEQEAKKIYNPQNFSDALRAKYEKLFGDKAGPIGKIVSDELNHLSDRVVEYNKKITAEYEKKLAEYEKLGKPRSDEEGAARVKTLNAVYNRPITLNDVVPGHPLWEAMKKDIITKFDVANQAAKVQETLDPDLVNAVKNQLDQALRYVDNENKVVAMKNYVAKQQRLHKEDYKKYEANFKTATKAAEAKPQTDYAAQKKVLDEITAYSKIDGREIPAAIARAQVTGKDFRGQKPKDGYVVVKYAKDGADHFRRTLPEDIRPGEAQVWPPAQAEKLNFAEPGSERERVYQEIRKTGYNEKHTQASLGLMDAFADAWARDHGRDPEDFFKSLTFQKGDKVEAEALKQIDRHEFEKRMALPKAVADEHLEFHKTGEKTPPKLGDKVLRYDKPDGKKFVYGKLTPEEWKARAEDYLGKPGSAEFRDARMWYEDVHKKFVSVFGKEDADQYMLGWFLSQVNIAPSGGMLNLLRAEDKVQGGVLDKVAGSDRDVESALMAVMREEVPDRGQAVKIRDFLDSGLLKDTRAWTGDAKDGGQPVAIDIWALRGLGFIDPTSLKEIAKYAPALAKELGKELDTSGGGPSLAQTEYGNKYYNDLADHLNATNYDGGGWKPYQAQALDWVAIQRMFGKPSEGPNEVFSKNYRNLAVEINPGEGTQFEQAFPAFDKISKEAQKAIHKDILDSTLKQAADLAGVKIVGRDDATGGYHTSTSPSTTLSVFGSPERVEDFAQILGYIYQQEGVLGYRVMKSGSSPTVTFLDDTDTLKLGDYATLERVWNRVVELEPEFGKRFGFMQYRNGGHDGITMMFDSKDAAKVRPRIMTAVSQAMDDVFGKEVELVYDDTAMLDTFGSKNDWTVQRNGETYLQKIAERRPGLEKRVEDTGRRVFEVAQRAWETHAPEALREHGSPESFIQEVKRDEEPALAQEGNQKVLGTTQLLKDGRYLVSLFDNANASTVPHELAHVFRQYLDKGLLSAAEEWAGVAPGGKWSVDAEEKFARGFERYLREGAKKDTPEALKSVFDQFKTWLVNIYQKIMGSEINVDIAKARPIFNKMLGGKADLAVREAAKPTARATTRLATPTEKTEVKAAEPPPTPAPSALAGLPEPSLPKPAGTANKPAGTAKPTTVRVHIDKYGAEPEVTHNADGSHTAAFKVSSGGQDTGFRVFTQWNGRPDAKPWDGYDSVWHVKKEGPDGSYEYQGHYKLGESRLTNIIKGYIRSEKAGEAAPTTLAQAAPSHAGDLESYKQQLSSPPPTETFPAAGGTGVVRSLSELKDIAHNWNETGQVDENGNDISKPMSHAQKVQATRDILATDEYIRKVTLNTFMLDPDTMAPVRISDKKSLDELTGGTKPASIGEPMPKWPTSQPPNEPAKIVAEVEKFFGKNAYKSFADLEKEKGKEAVDAAISEIASRLDFPDPTNLNVPTEKTGFETGQGRIAMRELEKDATDRHNQYLDERASRSAAQDKYDQAYKGLEQGIQGIQAQARQVADRGAYNRIEGTYFDYRNKNTIDQMLGSLLPFNYWMRRNFAYLAKYFAANPVQFAAVLQLYKNIEAQNQAAGDIAPWNMANLLLWTNPDGSKVQWNMSSMFPFNPIGNSDAFLQMVSPDDPDIQSGNVTTGPLAVLFGSDRAYNGKITGRDKGIIPTFLTPNPIFNILTQTGLVNKWAKDAGLVTDGFLSPDPSDKRAQRQTIGLVSGRTAIRDVGAKTGFTNWLRTELEPMGIKLADLDLEGPLDNLLFGMNAGKPLTAVSEELTEMAQGDPKNQEKYLLALAKLKQGNWTPEALKALDSVEAGDSWRRLASEAGFVAVTNNTPREQLNSQLGKTYGEVAQDKGHYDITSTDPKTGYQTRKFVPGASQDFFDKNAGASVSFAKNKTPDQIIESVGNDRTSKALTDLNRAYYDEHKMDLRTYNKKMDDLRAGNPTFFKVQKDKDYQQSKGELPYLPGEQHLNQSEVDTKYAKIEKPDERGYSEFKDDLYRAGGSGRYSELAQKAHDLYAAGSKQASYALSHSDEYLKLKAAEDAIKKASPQYADRYANETAAKYPDQAAASTTGGTASSGSGTKTSYSSSSSTSGASSTPFTPAQNRVYAQALAAGLSKTQAAAKARATTTTSTSTSQAKAPASTAKAPATPSAATTTPWDAVAKKAYALALGDGYTKAYATVVANRFMDGTTTYYKSKTTGAVASRSGTTKATAATSTPGTTTTGKTTAPTATKAAAANGTIANANSSGYTNFVTSGIHLAPHSGGGGGGGSKAVKSTPVHPIGSPYKVPSPYSGSLNRFIKRRRY